MVLLSLTVFFLIFCWLDLSISDKGVLKSLTTIVDLSVSLCNSISFFLTLFDVLLLGACIDTLRKLCLLGELAPLSLCNALFFYL